MSVDATRRIGDALGLPVVALVRPEPDAVKRRLLQAGYAPLPPPAPFAGRRRELALIVEVLGHAHDGATCCLSGASGMGKTALAAMAAETVGDRFSDGVVWISAPDESVPERVDLIQRDVADALGFGSRLPDRFVVGARAVDRAFQAQLFGRRRLLIVDDVRSMTELRRFVAAAPSWAIVTTSHRSVAHRFENRVEVGPLSEDEALELLRTHVGAGRVDGDDDGARQLVGLLGGVPRSLQIAGRVLRAEPYTSFGEYAGELTRAPTGWTERESAPWLSSSDPDATFAGAQRQILRRLPEGHWQALGALAIFGDRAFDLPWAAAAADRSRAEVRHVIGDLSDLYLVHEVERAGQPMTPEPPANRPRFRLDAQAERVARWIARDELTALEQRLVDFGLDEAGRLGSLRPDRALPGILDNLEMWRLCLQIAAEGLLDGPVDRVPSSLEELPAVTLDEIERALVLPRLLLGLRAWFFLRPPREGLHWLVGALAVAHALDRDELLAPLASALCMWLVLTVPQVDLAGRWALVAADAFERSGRVDEAVQALASAAASVHASEGTEAALELSRQALDRVQGEAVSAIRLAGLLNNVGVLTAFASDDPDTLSDASAPLDEACELVQSALDTAEPTDDVTWTVWSVATVNRAVIRRLASEPVNLDDVRVALRHLTEQNEVDALERYRYEVLAHFLARVPEPGDDATEARRRRNILLTTPPELLERRLIKLAEACTYRGFPVLGGAETPTLLLAEDENEGAPTRVGVTEALMGLPVGARFGQPMALLYPVEPLDGLLDEVSWPVALNLVEHAWGRDHPLHAALAGMSK